MTQTQCLMCQFVPPGGDTCPSTGHVVNKCASTSPISARFYSSITVPIRHSHNIT